MAESTTSTAPESIDTAAANQHLSPGDAGLASPENETFVSAPTTPLLETQESTPATTLTPDNEQEKEPEHLQIPANGPMKTIVGYPVPDAIPKKRAPLTAEQQSKYDAVLETVQKWDTVPASTARNAALEPIQEHERMWLTKECLLRYLRATKWSVPQAIKRLQSSMAWRKEYGADKFTADYISPENETGKQVLIGYDVEGRPCWYMTPSRQNTKLSDRQIHQVSYMLDRSVDLMPPGQETICLLISFKDSSRGAVPSVGLGRQALNVLQNHNPERLGRALIMDMPWFVTTFFKLISPFIDPLTKEKIVFDPDLRKQIPGAQLINWYKGDLDFEYDHSVYWPALEKETDKRRAAYRKRWEAAGKMIGENEAYLRGGDCKPIREERAAAASAAAALPDEVNKLNLR